MGYQFRWDKEKLVNTNNKINIKLISLLLIVMSFNVNAEIVYQLRPDGSRDYTKPAMEIKNGEIYYLRKDGTRDYTKPVRRIEPSKTSQSSLPNSIKK